MGCERMIGVIDVGGGLRGIYGAGIFDYCIDNDINFDYCIGVSAGSANIASYLGKQKGRNYKFYLEYIFRKDYMSIKNLLKKGSYIDLDYVYGSLSNSDGEYPLNYDIIKKSNSIMKVVSSNAITGEVVYFDKNDLLKDNYYIFKASCCIPVVCKPYFVEGIPYFDGGLADPIPINKAFKDGCSKVVVILTKPIDYERTQKKDFLISTILQRKYPKSAQNLLMRYKKYNDSVKLTKKYVKDNRAFILAPDNCCGVDTLTKNPENLKTLYYKGYNDAKALLNFIK